MRVKNLSLYDSIEKFIDEYSDSHDGRCPSVREIGKANNISAATVTRYMSDMKENGVLQYGGHRNIKTLSKMKELSETMKVPVLGAVSCGVPKFAEENIEEYVKLPTSLFGSGDYFILRANGDSMINAGIDNGDLVLIRQQATADDGQIVVALYEDEATLKRIYRRDGKVVLHAENENYEDIILDTCSIQGVAKKVIKDIV